MPDLKITPVYRSDNSGSTYAFTDYLSNVNGTWKSKVGTGVKAAWKLAYAVYLDTFYGCEYE